MHDYVSCLPIEETQSGASKLFMCRPNKKLFMWKRTIINNFVFAFPPLLLHLQVSK